MSDKDRYRSIVPIGSKVPAVPTSTINSDFLNAILESAAKNVRDRYYRGKTIYLDGYSFTNCCFHDCTLVTDTGVFSIDRCTFLNVNYQYGPNALRILQLYNLGAGRFFESGFSPSVATDLSVTIR
jgi:hypothetical protein